MLSDLVHRVRVRGGKWGIRSLRLNLALVDADGDGVVTDDELITALKRYGLGTVTHEDVVSTLSNSTAVTLESSSRQDVVLQPQPASLRTQYTSDFTAKGPARLSVRDAMPSLKPVSTRPRLAKISVFGVMHVMTGMLSRARLQAITAAYAILTRTFADAPTLEQVCSVVGLDRHPDVVAGCVQLPDALFCFFTLWGVDMSCSVTEDLFVQYFGDWSPAFQRDSDFVDFMIMCFGKPEPDAKLQRKKLAPSREESDKLFASIDMNGNGTLSLAELDLAVIRFWPSLNYKPAIMRAYKLADDSGNGWLDKEEFFKFLNYLVVYVEYHEKFQRIDTDRSGSITLDELLANKEAAGLGNMNDVQLRNVFKSIDSNNGGKILLEEFCLWLAKRNGDAALTKKTNQF